MCPGWESNPHEEKSPEDFKSSASAIPPPGHRQITHSLYRLTGVQRTKTAPLFQTGARLNQRNHLLYLVSMKFCMNTNTTVTATGPSKPRIIATVPTNRPTSTSAIARLRTTDFVVHSVSLRKFTQGDSMTEERKPAILFAATILAARKLQPMQKQK